MSPHNNNNSGSNGRAAPPVHCRDAARAEEIRAASRGVGVMALAISVLAVNAPEFWPMLFAH